MAARLIPQSWTVAFHLDVDWNLHASVDTQRVSLVCRETLKATYQGSRVSHMCCMENVAYIT